MSFLRLLGTNFILLLAIVADIITVAILLHKPNEFSTSDGIWIIYYSNILISILAISLFLRVTYLQVKWGRKKRYARAFKIINQGFAEVHELERLGEPDSLIKLNALEKLCDALAQTFRHITLADCGVCIKILSELDNRLEVTTLSRDSISKNSRPLQEKDTASKLHHWVDANTDFNTIIHNMDSTEKRFFCCNNLLWLSDYKNSRIPNIDKPVTNSFILNFIYKWWTWPLPYRSCLVVPIIPLYFNTKNAIMAGFLCVDSRIPYIFKKEYDLSIAQGVADGLYNVLYKYYNLYELKVR